MSGERREGGERRDRPMWRFAKREGGGDRHAARALNLLKSEHAEDSAQVSRAERKPARRPQRCKKKKKRKKEKEKEKKKEKKKGTTARRTKTKEMSVSDV